MGNNPYNSDASYEVDGPGPLTNPTARWYWNETGNDSSKTETVSCTATVTPPPGQGAAFSVTASQPVTVWSPSWTGTSIGGEVDVTTDDPDGNGTDYWLDAVATPTELQVGIGRGMTWKATVAPPTNSPVAFGSGSLILTQVILQFQQDYSNVEGPVKDAQDGHSGLDTDYPYGWATGAPNYLSGDTPGMDLTALGAIDATENLTFEDYLMYFPPNSSQCVTLGHYTWVVSGTANLTSGGWSPSNPVGTITDSGRTGSFIQANDFPNWTEIITGS